MSVPLSAVLKMPVVGFGTWKSEPNLVGNATEEAIRIGYRHIDCAALYQNEHEIGVAFENIFNEGIVKRDDLFVTSKLWNTDWGRVRAACLKTLSDLKLEYLDLYLVHSPASWEYRDGKMWDVREDGSPYMGSVPMHVMWREMEKLVDEGLVKNIGISNFSCMVVNDLLTYARIKPTCQQIEIHPYFQQRYNTKYCQEHGMDVVAYSPLGNAQADGVLFDPIVAEIAAKHSVTPAQVLIKFCIQLGVIPIPKSTHKERIVQNIDVFGLTLTEDDMKKLLSLDRKEGRTCNHQVYWNWPCYE